jgi:hypothetical protein
MASRVRPGKLVPAVLVVAAVFLAAPNRAHAQFGFGGFGWGMGFGFRPVPPPESYLYQKSLVDASRPVNIPSRDVNANNPNSFINHLRDPGFVDRYSVDRREIPDYRYYGSRPRRGGASTTPTAAGTGQGRILPLFSFYSAAGKLEWPAEAPIEGELKAKRDTVDQACDVVLSEIKKDGVAALASVTDARQKLLDYGRPALANARAHQTPRVADTFHMFLLSLYDSLAQAASPATTTPAPPQPINR